MRKSPEPEVTITATETTTVVLKMPAAREDFYTSTSPQNSLREGRYWRVQPTLAQIHAFYDAIVKAGGRPDEKVDVTGEMVTWAREKPL